LDNFSPKIWHGDVDEIKWEIFRHLVFTGIFLLGKKVC